MLPTPKSAHRDAALTNISVAHSNQNYIADRVFQNVPVAKQSDYFYTYRKGAWFRNEAARRGPGSKAARGGYPITDTQYVCTEYAFGHPVPIELLNNADAVLRPFESGARFATDKILLAKEKIVSDMVVTSGNWTSSNDVEGGWAAGEANTFITDMLTGIRTVRQLIGVPPNVMLMDSKTLDQLKQDSSILDRIKYTGTQGKPADVTPSVLAQMFELDEVLIGTTIYSSDEEIVAGTDFTAVDLWEATATKGSCFLYYRPPAPGIEIPAAGYVFNWKGDAGNENPVISQDVYRDVRYYWEEAEKQWVIEASECFDAQVVSADAGYLFYDTIST